MKKLPQRKSIRLDNYDYSQNGYYFVTVCTQDRVNILSDISRGGVLLRPIGKIAEAELMALQDRYGIKIDCYVIMPNHIHFIVCINKNDNNMLNRAEQSPAPTVADIICAFKSISTKYINLYENCQGRKLWQRNYYEHIIRNKEDYVRIAEYIKNNPLNWENDHEYHP